MLKKFLLPLILFISTYISAADIFVDQSAAAGGDGSTWALAFQDIQSAVDVAAAGDTIFIAEGIYRPEETIEIDFPLNFRGGYPSGGGVQNIDANITQIQADFDTGNLLLEVFDINPNAATSLTGLHFFNCRRAISTASNLTINQLQFNQLSNTAINLVGTFDFCSIENSFFNDFSADIITGFSVNLVNFSVSKSIFQNGTARGINLGDDVTNFTMSDCVIRDFNNSTATISVDTATATFSNLLAENNVSTSGAIIYFRESNVTIEQSTFNNNSGEGTLCLQGSYGQLNLIESNFTNNSSISTFPKPVMGMRDVVLTATNCLFKDNYAEGSQPDAVGEIRGDNTDALITFESCDFIDNSSIGSITSILDISYGSSPFINNCVFEGNLSDSNNAINSFNSTGAVITNNTFRNHTTDEELVFISNGGAGYDVVLQNNIFIDNSFTKIGVNRFDNLTIRNNSYVGDNIVLDIWRIPNVTITNDFFKGNSSGDEFIEFDELTAEITNTIMISDVVSGTHTLIDSDNDTALEIINSTFTSTDIDDTHVRLNFDDDLPSLLQNSIIWSGNNNLTQSGFTGSTANLQVRYSLVKGENPTGTGNLNGTVAANTPLFVNPSDADFRMLNCSPTVNAGFNTYNSASQDLLGNTRIFETTIDMGAYELQVPANASCSTPDLPACTNLIAPGPTDGANGVDLNTTIYWNADSDATGYILRVGTALGLRDLVDEVLGNQTSYPLSNLPEETPIFVQIIPFNGEGNAPGCASESFNTIGDTIENLSCTYLISPANEDSITPSNLTQILWNSVDNANGYRVTVNGSTSDVNDVTNLIVNGTSHPFTNDFDEGETVNVTIIPFNNDGDATGCAPETFTIEAAALTPPDCTTLASPTDGDTNIAVNLNEITWDAVTNATQYSITIDGSTSNLNDVTDLIVSGTSHPFTNNFDNNETVTITITPLNGTVEPTIACGSESFTIVAAPPGNAFITNWQTTSSNEAITIPTTGGGYNYTVDWGDGNITTGENGDASHTYAVAGTYTVSISGDFPRIYFNNGNDKDKILTIEQWGNNPWITMERAFFGCTNLNITNNSIDTPNLTNVTVLDSMFEGCTNFNGDITNWDVSTVQTMRSLFREAIVFNQDIGGWDVSNVETLDRTFSDARTFNQDISGWDVSNVTNLLLTFWNAESFNQPIQSWDVSNVVTFARCFEETDVFNQPVGAWDTSSATDLSGVFSDAIAFNQDLSNWDVSNVTLFRNTFEGAVLFNQDLSSWDTSSAEDMLFMFRNATVFNQDISGWDVSQVYRTFAMFENATSFDQDLSTWNVENISTAERMFEGVTLSVPNYDAILIGWNNQTLHPNVTFSGGNSQYCDGETARNNMIASDNWTITDGGLAGPTVTDLADQTHANSYTLPNITGTQLTGGEAYFTETNGGGARYDVGDTVNFADFPSYPVTLYIYDGSGSCASEESFELTLTSTGTVPSSCADLASPLADTTDVPVDIGSISWDAVADATGYRVSIDGSTSTVNDITDQDIAGTSFTLPGNFDNGETVSVTIFPFNTTGDAVGCDTAQNFTIVAATPSVPGSCADLASPLANATDVAVDVGSISWGAVTEATAYRVTINGSTSDLNDETDLIVNGTSHPLANNFENGETVSVTIVPFNTTGDAVGCDTPQSFTIISSDAPILPECTELVTELNNATNVDVTTTIAWNAVNTADGYLVSIRTNTDEIILAETDLGMLTSYTPQEDLSFETTILVSITPYNSEGRNDSCSELSFVTTEEMEEPVEPEGPFEEDETKYGFSPDGDGINEFWEINGIENHPENIVYIYNRWGDMVFQIEGYDNGSNVFRGEANNLNALGANTLPAGTYFFRIQVSGETTMKKLTGYLVLKR